MVLGWGYVRVVPELSKLVRSKPCRTVRAADSADLIGICLPWEVVSVIQTFLAEMSMASSTLVPRYEV